MCSACKEPPTDCDGVRREYRELSHYAGECQSADDCTQLNIDCGSPVHKDALKTEAAKTLQALDKELGGCIGMDKCSRAPFKLDCVDRHCVNVQLDRWPEETGSVKPAAKPAVKPAAKPDIQTRKAL